MARRKTDFELGVMVGKRKLAKELTLLLASAASDTAGLSKVTVHILKTLDDTESLSSPAEKQELSKQPGPKSGHKKEGSCNGP